MRNNLIKQNQGIAKTKFLEMGGAIITNNQTINYVKTNK